MHPRLTVGLALSASLLAAAPAAAAEDPPPRIVGTPVLYSVTDPGQGRPSAYVVWRSSRHLHNPRQVVARVAGGSGRTYTSRRSGPRCYRSAFLRNDAEGRPRSIVRPGARATVTFQFRAGGERSTIATHRLIARRLPAGAAPPGC